MKTEPSTSPAADVKSPSKVFIGSSGKSLDYASGLLLALQGQPKETLKIECIYWPYAFGTGKYTLQELIRHTQECKFAIFVFNRDDLIYLNGNDSADNKTYTTRDNVIFELGLFIGRLGPERVIFCMPNEAADLHLPSDLRGLVYATYDGTSTGDKRTAMMGPVEELRRIYSAMEEQPSPLDIANSLVKLEASVSKLVDIAETRPVGVFPDYFRNQICALVNGSGELWIASDVVPYGGLSDAGTFKTYQTALVDRKGKVNIIVPTDDRIRAATQRQIPAEEWSRRFKDDKEFAEMIRQFEETIAEYSDDSDNTEAIDTPERFYDAVVAFNHRVLKRLKKSRSRRKETEVWQVDMDLPVYLWILDKIEAVFSVPMDRSGAEKNSFEYGFFTRVPDLIKGLSASWVRYRNQGQLDSSSPSGSDPTSGPSGPRK